jgi:integrase
LITLMPRPRPPHLHQQRSRHGRLVWYVRIGKGPRTRLNEVYGTPEFDAAYKAALAGESVRPGKPGGGTLRWLFDLYRQSQEWRDLSQATRRQRENIFRPIMEGAGKEPFAAIDKQTIRDGIKRRFSTPAQARHFLDCMRGLFKWAVESEIAKSDPTAGLKVKKPKTEGFPVWNDDEIAQFEKRWPLGTRERVMFDVFLYTGLRRGDAAKLGKQHIRNGVIEITTEKTGTRVTIPVLPVLAATLAAGPVGDLAIIATKTGAPMVKESLGNMFADACRAAGIRKSAHGLRKAAATVAANNGATVAQLEAIFGWEGGRMASLYTKSADRKKLAASGIGMMSRTKG